MIRKWFNLGNMARLVLVLIGAAVGWFIGGVFDGVIAIAVGCVAGYGIGWTGQSLIGTYIDKD